MSNELVPGRKRDIFVLWDGEVSVGNLPVGGVQGLQDQPGFITNKITIKYKFNS